jgi:serine/threonine protein kinase
MNGGVIHLPNYPNRESAVKYFHDHCRYRILSNSSVSCIAFECILDPGIESPFRHCRPGLYNKPIQSLLFKVFPIANDAGWLDVPGREYAGIEIGTRDKVVEEFDIQLDIYRHTYNTPSSLFEGICPYPLNCYYGPKRHVIRSICNSLVARNGRTIVDEVEEVQNTLGYSRNEIENLSFITMEFMAGFQIVNDVLNAETDEYKKDLIQSLARYELDRLHNIGYLHGDYHPGNAMVHLDYPYISFNPTKRIRVCIIDFGRTRRLTPNEQVNPMPIELVSRRNRSGNLEGNPNARYAQYRRDSSYEVFRNLRITFRNVFLDFLRHRGNLEADVQYIQRVIGGAEQNKRSSVLSSNKTMDTKKSFNFGEIDVATIEQEWFTDVDPDEIVRLMKQHIKEVDTQKNSYFEWKPKKVTKTTRTNRRPKSATKSVKKP